MKKVTLTALNKSLRDKIELDRKTNCWVWTGMVHRRQEGKVSPRSAERPIFSEGRRLSSAARVVWEVFEDEPLPRNVVVRHDCDNPKCVNPKHHHLSTTTDLMHEMRKRSSRVRSDPNRCVKGHDLTAPDATRINRHGLTVCRTCEFLRETAKWKLPSERRSSR